MILENQLPFWKRFIIYQKERFPFLGHGPLILMFSFSAVAYSRICRKQDGFIDWTDFLIGFITTFCLFFLLRILDEFKDKEIDAKYRKELPVPRGLISFKELKIMGAIVVLLPLIGILVVHPKMLIFYLIVLAYLALMTVEFFAHDWLNKNMWAYVGSHMIIIPLIDLYASGLDWFKDGVGPHAGLIFFFVVSYFNGIVLEVGRKLRDPQDEKEGVVTYSGMLGVKRSSILFIAVLSLTCFLSIAAIYYASIHFSSYIIIGIIYIIAFLLAYVYMKNPTTKNAKRVELASGIWTLLMYASLGGIPGLISYLI